MRHPYYISNEYRPVFRGFIIKEILPFIPFFCIFQLYSCLTDSNIKLILYKIIHLFSIIYNLKCSDYFHNSDLDTKSFLYFEKFNYELKWFKNDLLGISCVFCSNYFIWTKKCSYFNIFEHFTIISTFLLIYYFSNYIKIHNDKYNKIIKKIFMLQYLLLGKFVLYQYQKKYYKFVRNIYSIYSTGIFFYLLCDKLINNLYFRNHDIFHFFIIMGHIYSLIYTIF